MLRRPENVAIVPGDCLTVRQTDKRLVHERGRLEAVPNALSGHTSTRNSMQFLVDERDQRLKGFLVASAPPQEQPVDLRVMLRDATILSAYWPS